MNGLIHEGAAAIEGLRALPAALVVVRLRPPPFAGRLGQRQPAELARVHGRLQRPVGVGEARREDGAELHAVAVARLDDAVAALGRDLQRLLDDDVFAGVGRGDGRPQVGAARRRHDDGVNVRPGQGRGQVRIRRTIETKIGGDLAGVVGVAADQRGDTGAGNFRQGAGVEAGDHADADDDKTEVVFPCVRHGGPLRVISPAPSETARSPARRIAGRSAPSQSRWRKPGRDTPSPARSERGAALTC